MTRLPGIALLGFLCLFWNGLIGVFDVAMIGGLLNETRARTSFVETAGTIVTSKVAAHRNDDGASYKPEVHYTYEYEGTTYMGERLAFTILSSSDRSIAESAIESYPVGAAVTVLVDPDAPSDSVLDVSGEMRPNAVILFLMPFHCIGLALVAALVAAIRGKSRASEDPARRRFVVRADERHLVIAKPMLAAHWIFLIAFGLSTFIATFPVIFLAGFTAPGGLVGAVLLACAALAGTFAWRRAAKKRSPENYLHVDRRLGVFSYPADAPGEKLENVRSIELDSRPTSTTINDELQYDHLIEIGTTRGPIELFEFRSGRDQGEVLKRLLEEELRLV